MANVPENPCIHNPGVNCLYWRAVEKYGSPRCFGLVVGVAVCPKVPRYQIPESARDQTRTDQRVSQLLASLVGKLTQSRR